MPSTFLKTVYTGSPLVQNISATLAEIVADKTLITGITGRKILVYDFWWIVTGTFTTATSIDLQSTNATPVKVAVQAIAGAGDGVVVHPLHANMTLGAGFCVALGAGDGLEVVDVGSELAGGTSILFNISYILQDA